MGASREARPSEVTLGWVWAEMRNLSNCVWYPLYEDAIEHIYTIKSNLDRVAEQMEAERKLEGEDG